MKDVLFAELLESVREGGAILKGEAAPSRAFEVGLPTHTRQLRQTVADGR